MQITKSSEQQTIKTFDCSTGFSTKRTYTYFPFIAFYQSDGQLIKRKQLYSDIQTQELLQHKEVWKAERRTLKSRPGRITGGVLLLITDLTEREAQL